jgi:hypothetical protein
MTQEADMPYKDPDERKARKKANYTKTMRDPLLHEIKKQRRRDWYAKNSERLRVEQKAYRERKAEQISESRKVYRERNKDLIRERLKEHRTRRKEQVIQAYGGRCEVCGLSELRFLTIDHSFRDGGVHRRRISRGKNTGGTAIYRDIIKRGFPKDEGYRVLCWNHNCGGI